MAGGKKVDEDDDKVMRVEMQERGREKEDEEKDKGGRKKQSHGYGEIEDQSLWTRFELPLIGEVRFNPIVSFFAIAIIWTFVIICIIYKVSQPWVYAAAFGGVADGLSFSDRRSIL